LRELTFRGAHARYGTHIPTRCEPSSSGSSTSSTTWTMVAISDHVGNRPVLSPLRHFLSGTWSAANSAVCYCLGITAIDPVRMDLLFERFMSRERAEPPDIDLDIEHQRRRGGSSNGSIGTYGRRHAAMVANVVSYRTRSAVRDVGKVLGIPLPFLGRMAAMLHVHDLQLDEALFAT